MDTPLIRETLSVARDYGNETPDIVWRTRYARDVGDLLETQDFTYCVYCGQRFKLDDDGTQVTEHVRGCVKHPMYHLRFLANEVVHDFLKGSPDEAIRTLQRFLREES